MGSSLPSRGNGRGRGRGRRAPMSEINVTPMVDVMLVLLIIFMITAPMLAAGVPVDLPESRAAALDQQAKPVQISLDAGGNIFIDDAPVSSADLPAQLAAIAAVPEPAEGRRIYLRADKKLDYGRVNWVMGELNRAGLNRVAMVSVGAETP